MFRCSPPIADQCTVIWHILSITQLLYV